MRNCYVLILALLMAAGCASSGDQGGEVKVSQGEYAGMFRSRMRDLAQELTDKMSGFQPDSTMVVVTTFTQAGVYEKSDVFGKLCAEQMMIGLSERKFRVFDMRKTRNILVKDDEGFFSLSEKIDNLQGKVRTELILVGNYALVSTDMIITVMLIKADDGSVVSTATQVLGIAGDEFLGPIISQLNSGGGEKDFLNVREPAMAGLDSQQKFLDLKIQKISAEIVKNMGNVKLRKQLVVATYVDLDNLDKTNGLGRYISENLTDELYKYGFRVVEVRVAKELSSEQGVGETILTRDAEKLLRRYDADAYVVGTYRKIDNVIKVNTRMVLPGNQEIISVASIDIPADPKDKFMESLLGNEFVKIDAGESVEGF